MVVAYSERVPKLWNATIKTHRQKVREAVLDATATLMTDHGLRSVTMSHIAEQVGIGRATLYKYFPDLDAILHAWHHREITRHLHHLTDVRDRADNPSQQLRAVLEAYAHLAHQSHGHHDRELVAFLHHDDDQHLAHAQQQLHDLIRELIAEGVHTGGLRTDVTPDELASYCLHALTAARTLPTAAIQRLVTVTLTGLQATSTTR